LNRREAKSLLPWYLAGKLPLDEMQAVQELVDRGDITAADLDAVRLVGEALAEPDLHGQRYDPQILEQVLNGHEPQPGSRGDDAPMVVVKERRPGNDDGDRWLERLGERMQWSTTPKPMRTALAVQLTLLLCLAAGLMIVATNPATGVPQRLTSTVPGDYTVTFAPGVTEAQIRALLLEARASIVAGPSAVGLYTIAFDAEIDARAAAERIEASGLITFLQRAARP